MWYYTRPLNSLHLKSWFRQWNCITTKVSDGSVMEDISCLRQPFHRVSGAASSWHSCFLKMTSRPCMFCPNKIKCVQNSYWSLEPFSKGNKRRPVVPILSVNFCLQQHRHEHMVESYACSNRLIWGHLGKLCSH